MIITYNGVQLEIVRTNTADRTPVYTDDGQQYLHTLWTYDVEAVINPQAISYKPGPTSKKGQSPATTDAAVRHALSTPRGQLTITLEDNVELLKSPKTGYSCDAAGGPYPKLWSITSVHGVGSFLVRWTVQTAVRECTSPQPFIANRWTMTHDIDDDWFATRTINGTAHFDVGELLKQDKEPDEFRNQFFFPVPTNFQRAPVQVRASSDGSRVDYTVVDKEKPLNTYPGCPATRIEAFHTAWSSCPSVADAGYAYAKRAATNVSRLPEFLNIFNGGLSAMSKEALAMQISLVDAMLPQCYSHVVVRAWGPRNSTRKQLHNMAMAIAVGRFTAFDLALLPGHEISQTHSLTEKFVEINYTLRYGPNPMTIAKAGCIAIGREFPGTDDVNTSGGVVLTSSGRQNPNLPGDGGCRGSWVGLLVFQALQGACEAPE